MNKRYENDEIARIWSDENKVLEWQNTELAVIEARANLGRIEHGDFVTIRNSLSPVPVDIVRWKALEKDLNHDLNAFVQERQGHIPAELRRHFHDRMTSYDTEEPAFARLLIQSIGKVVPAIGFLLQILRDLALKYRYTPMNARTHGQEAEMQSFGKRVLTWYVELALADQRLDLALDNLSYSKLSGAIGGYGNMDPELELEALKILGLKPFYGATQIIPRVVYLPTAEALCQIVQTIDKIATDIRLMARSGRPLVQEPFGKKQKGSSAMPHKKNTISTEKLEGMCRMAIGYLDMIRQNTKTWEERAIEQSSVERIAWPDLFHVAMHSLETITKVMKGLKIYPDNMLLEIIDSLGCYAAAQAKDFLKEYGINAGVDEESAYRIVQLAAFNVFQPGLIRQTMREKPIGSLEADLMIAVMVDVWEHPKSHKSIQEVIPAGELCESSELAAAEDDVRKWNTSLMTLFSDQTIRDKWDELFKPSYLLRGEDHLFKQVFGQ